MPLGASLVFMSRMKLLLLLAVALLGVCWFSIDIIPPTSLTVSRMFVTKRRIMEFAHQQNRLPSSLAELPPWLPNHDSKTTDAWKRPLDYSVDATGLVTLRSLGADQQPGGEGDNRDFVGVFSTRDSQGKWRNELDQWDQDPGKPLRAPAK